MNPEGDRCKRFAVQRPPHFYKEVKSVKKCYGVRRIFSALLALAMLLVLAPAAAAQENAVNLLQDGSFEKDLWNGESPWTVNVSNWGQNNATTLSWSETAVHGGAHSANWYSSIGASITLSQTVELQPGTYTLSAFAKGENTDIKLFCDEQTWSGPALTDWETWDEAAAEFTVEAAGQYAVGITMACTGDNAWGYLDDVTLTLQDTAEPDLEIPDEGYYVTVSANQTQVTAGGTVHLSAVVYKDGEPVTDLAEEGLYLWFWADQWQTGHESAPVDAVFSNHDNNSGHSLTADAQLPSEGTYYLAAELKTEKDRLAIAFAAVEAAAVEEPQEPAPDPVEAEITVPYVAGSDGDFIRGVDVSSLLSLLNSGVVFRDADGNPLGNSVEAQGKAFMAQLAAAGVNWVRLRVWNEPYDAQRRGYGGGNNDLNAALQMGRWATEAGMQVLIDFHYSDFWADPGKQQAPKAWKDMTVDKKAAAVSTFTTESLSTLLDAGVNVGMVQIGNETNNGIAGVMYGTDGWESAAKLFKAGVDAVHAVGASHDKTILAAVHFTNPERGNYVSAFADNLAANGVNYDVFASSYYPYWHGTLENLTGQLKQVADKYDKKVMVAETSWATTLADGDGHDNTVRQGQNDTSNMSGKDWPFSVQGQAQEVADVARAVANVGENGIGLFYWEPAWQPVHNVSGLEGEAYEAQVAANRLAWEQYGSGWASSYAEEYDPDDAGKWYGGSAVDNQAMFDFDGKPLASLQVWKLMQTGSVAPKKVESADNPVLTVEAGSDGTAAVTLPFATTVYYSDGTSGTAPVVWETAGLDLNALPTGSYTVQGTVTVTPADTPVTVEVHCTLTVIYPNLLENPGFEEGSADYTLSENWPGHGITGNESGNLHSGSQYLHFYSDSASERSVTVQHSPVTLQPGQYTFTLYMQGEGASGRISVTDADGSELASADFAGTQWGDWQQPSLTFTLTEETVVTPGILLDIQPWGWGAVDDLYLGKLGDQAVEPTPDTPQEDNSSTPVQNQQTVTVSSTSKPAAAAASEPAAAATGTVGAIPQTGDTLPVAVLALLMVLSAAAMLGIALLRRKE